MPQPRKGPLRVAIVTPSVNRRGGTEKCLSWLIEDLSQRCHVTVFTGEMGDTDVTRCQVHRLWMVKHPRLLRYVTFLLSNTLVLALRRLLTRDRFDLLLATGGDCLFSDLVYAHFCCAAWVSMLHGQPELLPSVTLRQRLRNWHYLMFLGLAARVERAIYHSGRVRMVAAVSQGTKSELVHHYQLDPVRVAVVPDATDERVRLSSPDRTRFRSEVRARFKIRDDAILLLFVAAGDWKRKGFPLVLQALALVDDDRARLLAVGREEISFYEREAARLGIAHRVHFAGFSQKIERFYAAADIFVYPSHYESFSLVAIEAAAAGLAVIVPPVSGVAEWLRDGENGLFAERDAQDLSRKIRLLLRDPDLRHRLALRARAASRRYTRAAVVRQIAGLCSSIVDQGMEAA